MGVAIQVIFYFDPVMSSLNLAHLVPMRLFFMTGETKCTGGVGFDKGFCVQMV